MTVSNDFFEFIDYKFSDISLLNEALTHPSLSKIKKKNYQRLEFLGDKVLSLVISQYLIAKYPSEDEGQLSRRHAYLVSGDILSEIALFIGLDKIVMISQGEELSGGRVRKSNLENTLEALIGAIYLDSGFEESQKFILKFWHDLFDKNSAPPKDPVSELQEIAQSKNKTLPQYHIEKSGGSDHDPKFLATVKIDFCDLELKSFGSSKKEAQKKVAKLALEKIKENSN